MASEPRDPGVAGTAADDGPCASERRLVEERSALAERLGAILRSARDELRDAQRTLGVHEDRQGRAALAADPRHVQVRKADAFAVFRAARAHATGPADLEAAAAEWLREIDDVNRAFLSARRVMESERHEMGRIVTLVERRTVAVDRARVAAERSAEACREARERLAACEEVEAGGAAPGLLAAMGGPARPVETTSAEPEEAPAAGALGLDATLGVARPRIVAIILGDTAARDAVSVRLAAEGVTTAEHWAGLLDGLTAAIVDRALEEARFVFPADHEFWGLFRQDECRQIAVALAALGYHPIPGGGWVDDRVPGRRDLSLAVGFAGQDPMRLRIWPTEEEMASLFDRVEANVVDFLLEKAGGLTLGEVVALLGRHAEPFTELWNAWGRVRPLLLAESA